MEPANLSLSVPAVAVSAVSSDISSASGFLSPLYQVTNTFLGSVLQPQTLPWLLAQLEVDLSRPEDLLLSLQADWQVWARYFLGYVILLSLGVVFVVVMPVVGLCVCGCRCCCNRCGGRLNQTEPRGGRCQRLVLGLVLLALTTLVLLGVVCACLTNVALWEQTQPSGALSSVQARLADIDAYVGDTVRQLDSAVVGNYRAAKAGIFSTLDDVGPHTRDLIGNVTQVAPLLDSLYSFTANLPRLQTALQTADNASQSLQAEGAIFASQLASLRSDISDDASLCAPALPECAAVLRMLPDLRMGIDYNQLGDLSIAVLAIHYVIDDNLVQQVEQGLDDFLKVADSINHTWTGQVGEVKVEVNDIETEVQAVVDEMSSQIRDFNTSVISRDVEAVKDPVQLYGDYRFYASVAISVILFLIVVLLYLGLATGACCPRPSYYKSLSCTTKSGANFLLAAVGLIFLFSWVQMAVNMALFVSGGIVHTELCRHFQSLPDSGVIGVLDRALVQSLNLSISLQNVTARCSQNQTVYHALELEKLGVNISEILDPENYNLKDTIDQFKMINIDIGTVVVFSQATNDTLQVLQIGLDTVNITQFYNVLENNITALQFSELAAELEGAASQISTGPLSVRLQAHARLLRTYETTTIALLNETSSNMTIALKEVEQITESTPINDLIESLTSAQDNLNKNGNELIKGEINRTMDRVLATLLAAVADVDGAVRDEVGHCAPLYEAVNGLVDVGCHQFLDPYNGFWASQGWCLILFIPIMILAIQLAGSFRVAQSFSSVGEGEEGDRNAIPYDAYASAPNGESSTPNRQPHSLRLEMKGYKHLNTESAVRESVA